MVSCELPTANRQLPTANRQLPTDTVRPIAIGFGSSVGDRERQIRGAAALVADWLQDFSLSPIVETPAEGEGTADDPPFLNAVGIGLSAAPAAEIVARLLEIEGHLGRVRSRPNAPRTIDLDLILAGGDIVNEAGVVVPHPRFRDRRFVLEPLALVAPDMRDPVSGLTARELLARLVGS
jgi:2-amino-4-hydroxy-6-hydroxymethyldihydropteridine diphosphokinase